MLALGRTRLGQGVVHADVLALGIKLAESLFKFGGAKSRGDLLQIGRGLGKMLAQRVDKRSRAPHEHAAVPIVMTGIQKFLSTLGVGFFRKTPHSQHAARGAPAAGPSAASWCGRHPAPTPAWPAACGSAAKNACPGRRRGSRDKNSQAWRGLFNHNAV